MRFSEFHPSSSAMPEKMRVFGYVANDYQFVIAYDEMVQEYTASWKATEGHHGLAVQIDGYPFKTMKAAEEACKSTLRQLRMKS